VRHGIARAEGVACIVSHPRVDEGETRLLEGDRQEGEGTVARPDNAAHRSSAFAN